MANPLMENVKYFRRRQFALGPEYFPFEGWHRYTISDRYVLTAHPDLAVKQAGDQEFKVTLLGFIINPEAEESDEGRTLQELQSTRTLPGVIDVLFRASGRFVLIVNMGEEAFVFHDAAGLKQVLFCTDSSGVTWCASQAETLAERLGFAPDRDVLNFAQSPLFRSGKQEFWLMNTRSPYREIRQLLPNHYLDLKRGKPIRFWPTHAPIPTVSLADGIRRTEPILQRSIDVASRRFTLWMGISAGIDSRRTLAAAKRVSNRIGYFTIEHSPEGKVSMDVQTTGKLLPKLGLTRKVIVQRSMSEEFKRFYEASASFARTSKGNIAYTLLESLGSEIVVLNSNTAEISQCNYWLPKARITGEGLAIVTGLYHPLAIDEFNQWLDGARESCQASGLNIMGLFHWEQRAGRWAAASFGEYDIAHDSFTPYNNRLFIMRLMGISERYRRNRMWYVSLEQIKDMWPEALAVPINPPSGLGKRIREFIRRRVFHKFITPWFPIYEYFVFLSRKRKAYRVTRKMESPRPQA